MNDQTNRSQSASRQNGQSSVHARRFAETGKTALAKIGMALGHIRGWCSRHLPGGEKTLWLVVGLILLVLFVWAIMPGETVSSRGGRFGGMMGPQPVGVAVAQRSAIDVTLNALGTVTPLATVTVRPQVSGQIVRFAFQEGQMVKAGELLAEIDPRSFRAALDQAQGQLARDSALLANARIDLKRQQGLAKANATSQQALDTQAALVKQDEGTVMSDRANVAAAAVNFGFTRITSPVDGRVGIRQVDIGNFVSAGQASGIVVVTQLQPISVLFTVPEDNVGAIMARVNAGEQMAVDAYDRSQTTKLATGTLSAVDTQVDVTTGTVKLRAMFDNADDSLFPNQFVNVRLLVERLKDQVVVPAAAVQRGAEGTFVFVVKSDKTVAMRTVTLGPQQDDDVAIAKGLNPGETVVTDGADRLRDGAQVTIPSGQKVAKVAAAGNATALPGASVSREERRAKLMQACGADLKKYCGDAQGPAMFMCMREKRDSFSDGCQAALKAMHGHHGGGGGGGFGGGRGP
jgi:membrane fusion protein, multidrug efflux system